MPSAAHNIAVGHNNIPKYSDAALIVAITNDRHVAQQPGERDDGEALEKILSVQNYKTE